MPHSSSLLIHKSTPILIQTILSLNESMFRLLLLSLLKFVNLDLVNFSKTKSKRMSCNLSFNGSKESVFFYSIHKSHVKFNSLEEIFKMHKMACNMLASSQFSPQKEESTIVTCASSDFQGDKSCSKCHSVPVVMHSKCLMEDLNSECVTSSYPNSFSNLILPKFIEDYFRTFVGQCELSA